MIKGRHVRYWLMAVVLLFLLGGLTWIVKSAFAQWEAETNDVGHLELAVRLDPGNADFHLQLGRLYEYLPASLQPIEAMKEFRRAAELDPFDPSVWLNLAAAEEFDGKIAEAERDLHRADFLAPRLPNYQWPIGNFYLLHGNTEQSFRHLKMVLAGTRQYDQTLFETAWKASGDPQVILDQLIPDEISAEFSYLNYLVGKQKFPEAHALWARIQANHQRFDPLWTSSYMDGLIGTRRASEAFAVWSDLEKEGLLPYSGGGKPTNMVYDGDFEEGLPQLGFAWRISTVNGVFAGLDTLVFHSPSHAHLVQFSGKENLDYQNLFQYVKVEPRRAYHLRAFLKTENITTDSGPRLEVRDAYSPALLDKLSEGLTGSTGGWTEVDMDFQTCPQTELLVVVIRRLPSQKFDNLISGRVWLDDIFIVAE